MSSGATIAAIEDVYRRRYPRFLRVARATLGDEERARDVVQEAFARAIRSRFDFRGEGSLEGWIWRTLVNLCADERRSMEPRPQTEVVANGHPAEWPEVRAAVAALPERQLLALFRCLALGLRPDAPSNDNVINRVVEEFATHRRYTPPAPSPA